MVMLQFELLQIACAAFNAMAFALKSSVYHKINTRSNRHSTATVTALGKQFARSIINYIIAATRPMCIQPLLTVLLLLWLYMSSRTMCAFVCVCVCVPVRLCIYIQSSPNIEQPKRTVQTRTS